MKRYYIGCAAALLAGLLTGATPANAAKAHQPWIAYADDSGIQLIHADGSGHHTLVASKGARYPSWSPDGRWLAYAQLTEDSHVTAQTTINLIHPNGTGRRVVTEGYEPEWLNSKWILFHGVANIIGIRYDPGGLVKVNVETGAIKPIEIAHLTNRAYVGNGAGIPDYHLSPDRKSIYWNGTAGPEPLSGEATSTAETLKTVRLDGSGFHSITVKDEYSINIGGWMPGGNAVTYPCLRTSDTRKSSADLCKITLATGKVTDLSTPRRFAYAEEWSSPEPGGHRIVVGAADGLYVTNASGGEFRLLRHIKTSSGNPTGPVWQP